MGIFQDGKVSDFDPIYQVLEAIKALVALLGELLPSAATCTINVVKDYNDTPLAVRSAAVDTLQAMALHGMPLCVHGEVTDADIDVFDRERVFFKTKEAALLP